MELFIPGLCLFFLTIVLCFLILPRFTPLVIAILSIVVLVLAVWQHYTMFKDEYRFSTWQDTFKAYSPAIMIIAIILFIIYSILSFFTKGAVPVPSLPNITSASPNTTASQIVNSLNRVANSISNTGSNIVSSVNTMLSPGNQSNMAPNNRRNKNNLSRSFLETL
jgi:hypothetical protein